MMLGLVLRQQLSITGGATRSVFPAIEAWLDTDSDRWKAFTRIRASKVTWRYQSVMDFLLCEVAPEWRAECFAHYNDEGPPLHELATPGEIRALQSRLMLFLIIAYEAFCQKRRLSWSCAVELVDDILSRAA